jgi:hypothetical protein
VFATKLQFPFEITPYQKRWLGLMDDDAKRWVAILAARGASKTFTVALWCIKRMFNRPFSQISIVPGGSQEQGSQLMDYIKEIIGRNPKLYRSVKTWAATSMRLKNGSRLKIRPPTPTGVQSARGDIVVEEAELMKGDTAELMIPIASKSGNRIVLIGTPSAGSWFQRMWKKIPEEAKDIVKWQEAVASKVLTKEIIEDNRRMMSDNKFRAQYDCEWVDESGYRIRYAVGETPDVFLVAIGVDPNLNPGYAWVLVHRDGSDGYWAVAEGVFNELKEIANIPKGKIMFEDNGVQKLISQEAMQYRRDVVSDPWEERRKAANTEKMKVLSDRGKLHVSPSCPRTQRGLDELVFDMEGKIDKSKSGEHTHFADAFFHGVNGIYDAPSMISVEEPERWV